MLAMSAHGPKQTWPWSGLTSASSGEADTCRLGSGMSANDRERTFAAHANLEAFLPRHAAQKPQFVFKYDQRERRGIAAF